MSWLRLDEDFAEHPHVAPGGFPARATWVLLLTVTKRYGQGGELSAAACDPAYLANLWGMEEAVVRTGLGSLERLGAFTRTASGGTLIPNWAKYQPDPRPAGRDRPGDTPEVPGSPRDQLGVPATGRDGTPESGSGPVRQTSPDPESAPESAKKAEAAERTRTAERILAHLNAQTGRDFRPLPATLAPIRARLREGATEDECRGVVDRQVAAWAGGDMAKYLRPMTLFGSKFESYRATRTAGALVSAAQVEWAAGRGKNTL